MSTSTRLRQLADRMGLDGFAEELREIAGELEAKASPAVPQGKRYTVEPHGSGYAVYDGRDIWHHGLNLAHITETTPEVAKLIERGLNALAAPSKEPTWDQNAYVCKGAWSLGTACGKCAKCIATKPAQEPVTLTRDDIIRMAREAGMAPACWEGELSFQLLERFAIIAALREKEAGK